VVGLKKRAVLVLIGPCWELFWTGKIKENRVRGKLEVNLGRARNKGDGKKWVCGVPNGVPSPFRVRKKKGGGPTPVTTVEGGGWK